MLKIGEVTVICDESKIMVLLEQCKKCPRLKNIVKLGPTVTDGEKEAGEKVGVKVTSFKVLEVSIVKEEYSWKFFFFCDTILMVIFWEGNYDSGYKYMCRDGV